MLEIRRKFRAAVSLSRIFQSAQSVAGSQPLRMGCSTATEKNIATEICVCNDKDSCNTGKDTLYVHRIKFMKFVFRTHANLIFWLVIIKTVKEAQAALPLLVLSAQREKFLPNLETAGLSCWRWIQTFYRYLLQKRVNQIHVWVLMRASLTARPRPFLWVGG